MDKTKFEMWSIKKQSKSHCWWLDFDWCEHEKKKCAFSICPLKVKGSHVNINTYGKVIEKIPD